MSSTADGTADRTTRILKQRAEELARPLETEQQDTVCSVAVLALGAERVAIEAGFLREIVKVPPIATLPGTPPWIAGITQLRGELLAAVDLALWLGVDSPGDRLLLAVVEAPEGPLGLLVERVVGFREIRSDEISTMAAADPRRPVRAITRDLVTTLDIERLLASESLRVGHPSSARAPSAATDQPAAPSAPKPGPRARSDRS